MAYIESFAIYGLANRSAVLRRTLDRNVNIFWGVNGAGKTSLLKILHSALRNDASILYRVPFSRAEVVFWSTDHSAKLRRTISLEEELMFPISEDFEAEDQIDAEFLAYADLHEREWQTEVLTPGDIPRKDAPFMHTFLPISRLTRLDIARRAPGSSRGVVDESALDRDFATQVTRKWHDYNSSALTKVRYIQQQGIAAILAHLFGGASGGPVRRDVNLSNKEAYELVRRFMREQNLYLTFGFPEFLRRYQENADLHGVVSNIQDVMSEVEEALRPQIEFQQVIERLYSGGKHLTVGGSARTRSGGLSVEAGNSRIPLESLSSGEKQLLRLMLETLAADQGTIMIDEPEISMHVDWQQVLVQSMMRVNPDCQLLLATHSPEIMADVPVKYVFEL